MESLKEFAQFIYKTKRNSLAIIPERIHAERIIDKLMTLLFGQGCSKNEFMITACLDTVKKELCEVISMCCHADDTTAESMANAFFETLIPVYNSLLQDAAFIEASDPATNSIDEVIITYPGFYAIAVHRFAHELYKLDIPYLPRLMSEYAHSRTGIDIHPGAKIGHGFFRIPAQWYFRHCAESAFLVCACTAGLVVPAEHPYVRTAFALQFQETSLLKATHAVLLARAPMATSMVLVGGRFFSLS